LKSNLVSKWLLKKPSETCFKAGSCFKIRIEGLNDNIKLKLAELQKKGIGEHTGNGFGRFIVNMQQKDHYIRDNSINLNTDKPEGSIPDITQEVIKDVAIRSYLTIAEVQALKDGSGFNKNIDKIPTNSLLGRLVFMIKESDNGADFISKVSELPETATNSIRRCRNDQINLYEFINSSDTHVLGILNKDQDLQNCCSLIGFEPLNNEESKSKIFSHYWLTFLAIMRKKNKKGRD